MSEFFLGEIRPFGGTFAPRSWAFCNGQLMAIAQNDTLFSLLGTTYGGDGQTTFALPDLRGRVPIGYGQGPGLSNYPIGASLGSEQVTVLTPQMPSHGHSVNAANAPATATSPADGMVAVPDQSGNLYLTPGGSETDVMLPPDTIGAAGGNQSHNNIMPTLAITYVIALEGIYPSRN